MTLKYTDSDLSAALAKGREEAAQWHDTQARITSRDNLYDWHTWSAAAIRALAPSSPGERLEIDRSGWDEEGQL